MNLTTLLADIEKRLVSEANIYEQLNILNPQLQKSNYIEYSNPNLIAKRRGYLADWQKKGLPTREQEWWHYTSLKEIQNMAWKLAPQMSGRTGHLLEASMLEFDAFRALFINGELLCHGNSESLACQTKPVGETEAPALSKSFPGLSEAANNKTYVLEIRQSMKIPIVIDFVCSESLIALFPRLHIVCGAGVQATVVLRFLGAHAVESDRFHLEQKDSGLDIFNQPIIMVDAQNGSELTLITEVAGNSRVRHFGEEHIVVHNSAKVKSIFVRSSGRQVRHESFLNIVGSGAQVFSGGAVLMDSAREQVSGDFASEVDFSSEMRHQVGGSTSSQLYKAIVGGRDRSSFTGSVAIEKGADFAESEQLCRHLLLSQQAEANARPILRIFADEVKATHGATVGDLRDEEIFYLRSRGLRLDQAHALLLAGFLQDVIEHVDHADVRRYLKNRLRKSGGL